MLTLLEVLYRTVHQVKCPCTVQQVNFTSIQSNYLLSGDNFPPGGFRLQAANIMSALKFLIIMMVLASFDPFPWFGGPTPAWARWLLDNKIYACMMTFFLFNGEKVLYMEIVIGRALDCTASVPVM